jgi:hypothetical protein
MSETQYAAPLFVDHDGDAVLLERVPLAGSDSSYNEAFIQDLVFDHPRALPVSEIDRAYEGLVPVCKELNTAAGPLDVLYVTPQGRLVIVEAKLWRNPEARRKVVGQILDYAKELSRWDYADLQREVSRVTNRKGNALYSIVREQHAGVEEAAFVDEVSRSLAKGRFLLLVVGDGIREGVGAIAEFLEQSGALEFTFGLVELALYRHAVHGTLVQPRVLAKSVVFRRTVFSLEGERLVESDVPEAEESVVEPTELEKFYLGFWPELIDELKLDDQSQPMPRSLGKVGNIFFPMPPGGGQAWVTVYFSQKDRAVGVFLTFMRGPLADDLFARLSAQREEIDAELGIEVTWDADDGKYVIACRLSIDGLRDPSNRGRIKTFFKDVINRYVNVFRPRLEAITADL